MTTRVKATFYEHAGRLSMTEWFTFGGLKRKHGKAVIVLNSERPGEQLTLEVPAQAMKDKLEAVLCDCTYHVERRDG